MRRHFLGIMGLALLMAGSHRPALAGAELKITPAVPAEGERVKVTLRLTSPFDGAAVVGRVHLAIDVASDEEIPESSVLSADDLAPLMELESTERNFLEDPLNADSVSLRGDGSEIVRRHWEVDVMPEQAARMPRPSLLTGATATGFYLAKASIDQQPYTLEWTLLAMVPSGIHATLSAQGQWYSVATLAQARALFVPQQDPAKLPAPPPVMLSGNKEPPPSPPPVDIIYGASAGTESAAALAGAIVKPPDNGEAFKAEVAFATRVAAVPMAKALERSSPHPDCLAWLPTAGSWIIPTASGSAVVTSTSVMDLPKDYTPWVRGLARGTDPAATLRESWIGSLGPQVRLMLKKFPSHREKGGDVWDVPLKNLPNVLLGLAALRAPADVNGNIGELPGQ